jgi:hypothetical protein
MEDNELLPDWFKGKLYNEGAVVTNSLTGDSCELNSVELSIYNSIVKIEDKMKNKKASVKEADLLVSGLIWFITNNLEAYNILLLKEEDY